MEGVLDRHRIGVLDAGDHRLGEADTLYHAAGEAAATLTPKYSCHGHACRGGRGSDLQRVDIAELRARLDLRAERIIRIVRC